MYRILSNVLERTSPYNKHSDFEASTSHQKLRKMKEKGYLRDNWPLAFHVQQMEDLEKETTRKNHILVFQ